MNEPQILYDSQPFPIKKRRVLSKPKASNIQNSTIFTSTNQYKIPPKLVFQTPKRKKTNKNTKAQSLKTGKNENQTVKKFPKEATQTNLFKTQRILKQFSRITEKYQQEKREKKTKKVYYSKNDLPPYSPFEIDQVGDLKSSADQNLNLIEGCNNKKNGNQKKKLDLKEKILEKGHNSLNIFLSGFNTSSEKTIKMEKDKKYKIEIEQEREKEIEQEIENKKENENVKENEKGNKNRYENEKENEKENQNKKEHENEKEKKKEIEIDKNKRSPSVTIPWEPLNFSIKEPTKWKHAPKIARKFLSTGGEFTYDLFFNPLIVSKLFQETNEGKRERRFDLQVLKLLSKQKLLLTQLERLKSFISIQYDSLFENSYFPSFGYYNNIQNPFKKNVSNPLFTSGGINRNYKISQKGRNQTKPIIDSSKGKVLSPEKLIIKNDPDFINAKKKISTMEKRGLSENNNEIQTTDNSQWGTRLNNNSKGENRNDYDQNKSNWELGYKFENKKDPWNDEKQNGNLGDNNKFEKNDNWGNKKKTDYNKDNWSKKSTESFGVSDSWENNKKNNNKNDSNIFEKKNDSWGGNNKFEKNDNWINEKKAYYNRGNWGNNSFDRFRGKNNSNWGNDRNRFEKKNETWGDNNKFEKKTDNLGGNNKFEKNDNWINEKKKDYNRDTWNENSLNQFRGKQNSNWGGDNNRFEKKIDSWGDNYKFEKKTDNLGGNKEFEKNDNWGNKKKTDYNQDSWNTSSLGRFREKNDYNWENDKFEKNNRLVTRKKRHYNRDHWSKNSTESFGVVENWENNKKNDNWGGNNRFEKKDDSWADNNNNFDENNKNNWYGKRKLRRRGYRVERGENYRRDPYRRVPYRRGSYKKDCHGEYEYRRDRFRKNDYRNGGSKGDTNRGDWGGKGETRTGGYKKF
ncbi:hypothetical protein M0813_12102 [Anaeramoeba flamelloides]|uniref:Uncharacterized protein n=1 Tax=Anaeramoeba flamelloides TaxID=1746091 RepID=A0ABQ8ZD50_9EUKA|nr:hypothetical protein M0813_12102 [Anaeramoeba flamelloides]